MVDGDKAIGRSLSFLDLNYVSYRRLPKQWKRNEACPVPYTFVSPEQTLAEFEQKATDYPNAGCDRAWVVEASSSKTNGVFPFESAHYIRRRSPH